ncbi:MarR family winged helix-turn-helix transcriptional regulator [Rhodovulum sp. DZ06]|uniref:MarR family winged helix-turn-helix transcriptional regulator n=1 Tax=Rhodovulum sp. DZ06 TaxID=3425126 RepID=UPI003D3439F8
MSEGDRGAGAGEGAPPFGLDAFLPYRMTRVAEEVSRRFARAYKDRYGMTRPEWRAIAVIGTLGEVTASDIRDHSTMHKTMVSRALAGLETRRWIARDPHPADGRAEVIRLTKQGAAAWADLLAMAEAWQAGLISALGTEAEALAPALAAIETRLGVAGPILRGEGEDD